MNALLEGDVARVGVIGIGAAPELRRARKRTRVGDVKLAPGRVLHTEHAFLDATRGLDARRGRRGARRGCRPPAARRSPSAARSPSTRPSTSGSSPSAPASAACRPAPATS